MILLDTDVLIEIEHGNDAIIGKLAELRQTNPGNITITSAVYAEFVFGYVQQNKMPPPQLDLFDVVDFDKESALVFARKKRELEQKGKPVPIFDLITASCAITQSSLLVSMDQHYQEISGLKLILLSRDEIE